jgi:hypothetical protein
MTWKPTVDIDQNVRRWMKAKGWEVTRTEPHPPYLGSLPTVLAISILFWARSRSQRPCL